MFFFLKYCIIDRLNSCVVCDLKLIFLSSAPSYTVNCICAIIYYALIAQLIKWLVLYVSSWFITCSTTPKGKYNHVSLCKFSCSKSRKFSFIFTFFLRATHENVKLQMTIFRPERKKCKEKQKAGWLSFICCFLSQNMLATWSPLFLHKQNFPPFAV